jgi:hypothetical protein
MIRRIALVGVVTVCGVVGLQELADATRNEGDRHVRGTSSEVVIDVRTRGRDVQLAADSIWAVCRLTVPAVRDVHPVAPVAGEGDRRFVVTVSPALGDNDQRRLRGCLSDAIVDRAQSQVVSIG